MNAPLIDLGGYGPVMSYGEIRAALAGKGQEPVVRAVVQVLALRREQAQVDAGRAAAEGLPGLAGLAGQAEGVRLALGDAHALLSGAEVGWLRELLGESKGGGVGNGE